MLIVVNMHNTPYFLLYRFFSSFIVHFNGKKIPSLSSQKMGTRLNQRQFERRAAMMGGGNFVVPAQCVTDFISNRLSGTGSAKTFKVVSNYLVFL
jgi:uncharacterized FAD-dependent dehydrogenase